MASRIASCQRLFEIATECTGFSLLAAQRDHSSTHVAPDCRLSLHGNRSWHNQRSEGAERHASDRKPGRPHMTDRNPRITMSPSFYSMIPIAVLVVLSAGPALVGQQRGSASGKWITAW